MYVHACGRKKEVRGKRGTGHAGERGYTADTGPKHGCPDVSGRSKHRCPGSKVSAGVKSVRHHYLVGGLVSPCRT